MNLLLRTVTRSNWVSCPGDPSADALKDLPTEKGALSLWRIKNGDELRILAAIAASRDYTSVMDYCYVAEEAATKLGIELVPTPGKTPDAAVNAFHVDAKDLTAVQLGNLAQACYKFGRPKRLTKTEVRKLIRDGYSAGRFETAIMKPDMRAKVTAGLI